MIKRIALLAMLLITGGMLVALSRPGNTTTATVVSEGPFDIVIRNGRFIDGTGSPWYSGDVGIRGGKIAAIANLANAESLRVVDARGMVVAPGFIDMLGQSELTILVNPHLPSKILQGDRK